MQRVQRATLPGRPLLTPALDGMRDRSGSVKRRHDNADKPSDERADKCGRYADNETEVDDDSGGGLL